MVFTVLAIALLIDHVVSLQKRLRIQFDEHFNLINSMREGVIVLLNQPTLTIKFYNKAAAKIYNKDAEQNQ